MGQKDVALGRDFIVPDAIVALFSQSDAAALVAQATPDPEAKFAFSAVKPGRYGIRITHAGLLAAEAVVRLQSSPFLVGRRNPRYMKFILGLAMGLCPYIKTVRSEMISP